MVWARVGVCVVVVVRLVVVVVLLVVVVVGLGVVVAFVVVVVALVVVVVGRVVVVAVVVVVGRVVVVVGRVVVVVAVVVVVVDVDTCVGFLCIFFIGFRSTGVSTVQTHTGSSVLRRLFTFMHVSGLSDLHLHLQFVTGKVFQ